MAQLRPSFISVDANKDSITTTAGILREAMPGRWVDFGIVTTTDPKQMQGLHDWYASGNEMSEQEFFGV